MQGTETMRPNRYDGPCWRCGARVPAMTGVYDSDKHRSLHPDGACKTTTRTYRQWLSAQLLADYREARAAMIAGAGYTLQESGRIEHPDVYAGHGLRVLFGGDRRGEVFGYGVRVLRRGELAAEFPKPRVETNHYYADRLAELAELLAALRPYEEDRLVELGGVEYKRSRCGSCKGTGERYDSTLADNVHTGGSGTVRCPACISSFEPGWVYAITGRGLQQEAARREARR
jgi:hypothetical protein